MGGGATVGLNWACGTLSAGTQNLGQRLLRLDYLGTQAELYAVGRGGTEEVRELMMRRLKDTT